VATARALNRQGRPVGAAYLSTASQLNRETLQPRANDLFQAARREAGAGYDDARSTGWLMLLLVLLVALAVALVWTQIYLSGSTRRTFNVPLLAASALTVVLAVGCAVIFTHQQARLDSADRDGSGPVEALAQKRISVLRERADEALTLAARTGHGELEEEFTRIAGELTFDDPELGGVRPLMTRAKAEHDAFVAVHRQIRALDDGGDYEGAVRLAVSDETKTTFEALTRTLDAALDDRRAIFDAEIPAAGRGLGPLTVLGPLLALAICVCATIGLRARLEEYR
jgi:hypothetical protein